MRVQPPMMTIKIWMPKKDHGCDGRILTKILAALKKIPKVYLKNDHLQPFATTFTKFHLKMTMVVDGHWSLVARLVAGPLPSCNFSLCCTINQNYVLSTVSWPWVYKPPWIVVFLCTMYYVHSAINIFTVEEAKFCSSVINSQ